MTEMNPVLYILMRNDLPSMNPGKMAAQASHASNAFIHEFENGEHDPKWDHLVEEWRESTTQGFGTVLVLAVNEREMRWAVSTAHLFGLITNVIHDPTYPVQIAPELGSALDEMGECAAFTVGERHNYATIPLDTCSYVFGNKNDSMLEVAVGQFPLHP